MTTAKLKFDIKKGPGKFNLMVALFQGELITFTISGPARSEYLVNVRIFGVQAEDGNRESWNIEGLMYHNDHGLDIVNFKGWYNPGSGHRKGHVTLENPISEIGEILTFGELRQYKVKTQKR